ncbi:MAG: cupin domain-containing protein [Gaiellaceae bacterium]
MNPGYEILSLDDLDRYPGAGEDSPVLMPLRRRLGFRPFGLNCWTAQAVGKHVIERHYERDGDEELYLVVRGRATFTVGDETFDAPVGTLVHCPPGTLREAVAAEEGTLVVAAGAKPGEAFVPAPWEDFAVAFAQARAGDVESARALVRDTLARHPGTWQGEYNAACFEALHGDLEEAFLHLVQGLRIAPDEVSRLAAEDDDFSALRGDDRWRELFA